MAQTEAKKKAGYVPVREKLGYGIASGGGNIITQILGTFLTGYLTDSVGVAVAAVGTMMLVTRIIDACSDVVMGGIVDRTHTKWGKARPWLLVSAPLILIALIIMFSESSAMSEGAIGEGLGFLLCGLFADSLPVIYFACVLKGFASGFLFSCGFAMAPDVVDYGEYKTGVRSEGLINSCVSFGQKVGLGLGPAIASWVLAAAGYNGTAEVQSASAINAIKFGFGYYGAILCALIAVIAFFMDLDKTQDEVRTALEAKHQEN